MRRQRCEDVTELDLKEEEGPGAKMLRQPAGAGELGNGSPTLQSPEGMQPCQQLGARTSDLENCELISH